jgi:hypothetical protein
MHAALAMALHNFRYKKCDLRLSFANPITVIPYLLIVSDEVEEWERERKDNDAQLPEDSKKKGEVKKTTRLIGITFKEKHAYVTVNHELKHSKLIENFKDYFIERLASQKKHYPIRIFYPQLGKEIHEDIWTTTYSQDGNFANMDAGAYRNMDGLIELKPESLIGLKAKPDEKAMFKKIADTQCQKKLLVPTEPNSKYVIYLDHRINGEPYLTVAFPL